MYTNISSISTCTLYTILLPNFTAAVYRLLYAAYGLHKYMQFNFIQYR